MEGRDEMTAFNVVRMRVKPGHEAEYLTFHRERALEDMAGLKSLRVVQTGERDFCFIGEWTSMEALAAARPAMIATLDVFRDKLEVGRGYGLWAAAAIGGARAAAAGIPGGRIQARESLFGYVGPVHRRIGRVRPGLGVRGLCATDVRVSCCVGWIER
jgi:quinol monooxygenase YgiN